MRFSLCRLIAWGRLIRSLILVRMLILGIIRGFLWLSSGSLSARVGFVFRFIAAFSCILAIRPEELV